MINYPIKSPLKNPLFSTYKVNCAFEIISFLMSKNSKTNAHYK